MGKKVSGLLAAAVLALGAAPGHAQLEPGWYENRSLVVQGTRRYFRYLLPENLGSAPPLVLYLHGGGSSMREVVDRNPSGAWPQVAAAQGFVLLLPNGVEPVSGDAFGDAQQWNDCRSDAGAATTAVDDVAFLTALVDWAVAELGVDADRIYVGGSSNGGMMSLRLADEAPARFAAVVTFIANRPAESECRRSGRPLPLMMVVGTRDPLMPFDGGQVATDRGLVHSAPESRDFWLARNRIGAAPRVSELLDRDALDGSVIVREDHEDPVSGLAVAFLRMEGAGHAVPSRSFRLSPFAERLLGPQNHDVEGPELAWAFLSRFERDQVVLFASDFE